MGLQFVRVHTQRGWVVVASDTTHFYENMMSGRPFTTAFHIGVMLEGFDTLRALRRPAAHRAGPRSTGDEGYPAAAPGACRDRGAARRHAGRIPDRDAVRSRPSSGVMARAGSRRSVAPLAQVLEDSWVLGASSTRAGD